MCKNHDFCISAKTGVIQNNISTKSRNKNSKADIGPKAGEDTFIGEFYQFNLSSCIRQQNSLTAQFVSFSLSNLANIFYPPQFLQ